MDASEARDRLEMVDKIVSASSTCLKTGGEFFVAWGLASGAWMLMLQFVSDGRLPPKALWAAAPIYLAALGFTIARGRYLEREGGRMSVLQREFFNLLWLANIMAFAVDAAGFNIFKGWAMAAIWLVSAAIVLFFVGMHGNRRAISAGIVALCALAIANFVPHVTGYALSAGFVLGYAGFGVLELIARD